MINNVDIYIAKAPKDLRPKLTAIRNAIKSVVPGATEKISYGMPYYDHKGRLAYFALAKNHIGLYVPPPIIQEFAADLKKFKTSVSAVQFPLNHELPLGLIKKIVLSRKKYNEAHNRNEKNL